MTEEYEVERERLTEALEEHRKEMKKYKALLIAGFAGIGALWVSMILLAWAMLG